MGACQSSSVAEAAPRRAKRTTKNTSLELESKEAVKYCAAELKECAKDESLREEDLTDGSLRDDSLNSFVGRKPCSSSSKGSTTRTKMEAWKEELNESGNLTKTVVNIETSISVESVYDGVHNGPILGTGAAGIVRKCTHRQTGIDFAVKCLNIGLIESDEIIESLREEIFIMCQADHPDIIRLEEVYESDSQIFLILCLMTGGDMFDRLEDQPDYCYSEVQCAQIVKQMTSAVRYLHTNKVIHRDLKLENFMFDNEDTDGIRLIDFGLSKHFGQSGEKHCLAVGTPYTIAPEIIQGEYDEKVDVWALGVITYLLLCGETPFGGMDGECLLTVRRNILESELVFEPSEIWDGISEEAKNFVRRCMTKDPEKRPSACEAQKDEWLVNSANLDPHQSQPLDPNLVKNLIGFKDYSNLQKILLEVVSFTLLPEQIKEMKKEFEKIDTDGNGEITLDELKEVLTTYNGRASTDASLGALTEDEVELIFDSLHLNTKATTIKWHKFIAAGLSQCDYDDRNLRLAFNRLDHAGKGFININDLNEMLRCNDGSMDEVILDMWKDGMKSVRCESKDRIYFEDFQRFFKQAPKQLELDSGSAHQPLQHQHPSGTRLDTLQEDSTAACPALGLSPRHNHKKRVSLTSRQLLTSALSPRHNTKKRVSLTSEMLLASTLALGLEDPSTSNESQHSFVGDEEDLAAIKNIPPLPQMSMSSGRTSSSGRSSFQMPPRRRSSGCAILVQSRDVGVFE